MPVEAEPAIRPTKVLDSSLSAKSKDIPKKNIAKPAATNAEQIAQSLAANRAKQTATLLSTEQEVKDKAAIPHPDDAKLEPSTPHLDKFSGLERILKGFAKFLMYGSAISNTLASSSFLHESLSGSKPASLGEKFRSYASKLTKSFYSVNSIANSFSRIRNNDWVSGLGHAWDIFASLVFGPANLLLARGISVGQYMFGNGVKDALKVNSFKGFKDHWQGVAKAIKLGFGYAKKDFFKNFMSAQTGLQSMIAGSLLFLGPIVWAITGSRFWGAVVRHTGAITQDLSQLKRDFILTKEEQQLGLIDQAAIITKRVLGINKAEKNMRPMYYRSGLAYVANTAIDMLGKLLDKLGAPKPLVNLLESSATYLFDSIGVYLQGKAQDEEVGLKFA